MTTPARKTIFWVHPFCLQLPETCETAGTPALFIWDNDFFQSYGLSLKRLVFIYETLLEMPVTIIAGNTAAILAAHDADTIVTWAHHDDRLNILMRQIEDHGCQITRLPIPAFATLPEGRRFTRFFQYWNKAQKQLLCRHGHS